MENLHTETQYWAAARQSDPSTFRHPTTQTICLYHLSKCVSMLGKECAADGAGNWDLGLEPQTRVMGRLRQQNELGNR